MTTAQFEYDNEAEFDANKATGKVAFFDKDRKRVGFPSDAAAPAPVPVPVASKVAPLPVDATVEAASGKINEVIKALSDAGLMGR